MLLAARFAKLVARLAIPFATPQEKFATRSTTFRGHRFARAIRFADIRCRDLEFATATMRNCRPASRESDDWRIYAPTFLLHFNVTSLTVKLPTRCVVMAITESMKVARYDKWFADRSRYENGRGHMSCQGSD